MEALLQREELIITKIDPGSSASTPGVSQREVDWTLDIIPIGCADARQTSHSINDPPAGRNGVPLPADDDEEVLPIALCEATLLTEEVAQGSILNNWITSSLGYTPKVEKKTRLTFDRVYQKSVYPCPSCWITYASPEYRDRHMRYCRPKTVKLPPDTVVPAERFLYTKCDPKASDPRRRRFQKQLSCPKCRFTTSDVHRLKDHMSSAHPRAPGPLLTCPLCPFTTPLAERLREHLAAHAPSPSPGPNPPPQPLPCPYPDCNYSANLKSKLKEHILISHPNNKSYSCKKCTFEGGSAEQLARHIVANHL